MSLEPELAKQSIVPKIEAAKTPKPRRCLPSSSREIVYEIPKQGFIPANGEDDDDDDDCVK